MKVKLYFLKVRCGSQLAVIFCLLASLLFPFAITSVHAEQTVLSGGVTLRQDYDSNIDRSSRNERSEWQTAVSPFLLLTSQGPDNSLSFRYAPSVVYSHRTDNERIDHHLSASLRKDLSQRLKTSFTDTFVRAEDPTTDEDTDVGGVVLSDTRGRNMYWSNSFDAGLQYEYAKESRFNLSWQNQILDNNGSGQEDFVKNSPGFSVLHYFNTQWQTQVDATFTDGNFDQTDDLKRNTGNLFLYYSQTPTAKLFGHYGYSKTDYDGLQDDYSRQSISLGMIRQQSATLDFRVEGGSVFLCRDEQSDKRELYYSLSLNQKTQKGSMHFTGAGGVDEQQFNGASDEGVSKYWSLKANINRELSKDISASIFCSYRRDTYLGQLADQEKKKLQTGVTVSHTFWQWYVVSIKYIYSKQTTDNFDERYDDNRVMMEFSFVKDFFKW